MDLSTDRSEGGSRLCRCTILYYASMAWAPGPAWASLSSGDPHPGRWRQQRDPDHRRLITTTTATRATKPINATITSTHVTGYPRPLRASLAGCFSGLGCYRKPARLYGLPTRLGSGHRIVLQGTEDAAPGFAPGWGWARRSGERAIQSSGVSGASVGLPATP
jgi:hypothetical protein